MAKLYSIVNSGGIYLVILRNLTSRRYAQWHFLCFFRVVLLEREIMVTMRII